MRERRKKHGAIGLIGLLIAGLLPMPISAQADIGAVQAYFRTDKAKSFEKRADEVAPVYAPLVAYWRGVMRLRRGDTAPIGQVAAAGESPYLRNLARRELLTHFIDRKDWDGVMRHAGDGDDCAGVFGALLRGGAAAQAAKPTLHKLWAADTRLRDAICRALYRHAHRTGHISKEAVWLKIRDTAGNHRLSATRRLIRLFPGYVRYQDVRKVVLRATRYIRSRHSLSTRARRELVMIAAVRAVRKSPQTAITRWEAFSQYFTAEDNRYVWTHLAHWAARWHRNDAMALFARGSTEYDNDDTRAWRLRTALRQGDYAAALAVYEQMPDEQKDVSAWQYWSAVALQKIAPDDAIATAQATQRLTALAEATDDYYGLLAREAVGLPLTRPAAAPPPRPPSGDLALALALYKDGLRDLAMKIWRVAARAEEDNTALLAAAQDAQRMNWYLASIDAANQSDAAGAHPLRFPTPFSDTILKYCRQFSLDPSFVFAIIRQESRFMPSIQSSANARGLMQVIPRTARYVARKYQYGKYRLSRLKRVDTNVIIGTTYMAELMRNFGGHPGKVAAAYNAGPKRVNRWYKASDDLLITIENIPLTETRLYVKYVAANRLHYRAAMGDPLPPFRTLIQTPIRRT